MDLKKFAQMKVATMSTQKLLNMAKPALKNRWARVASEPFKAKDALGRDVGFRAVKGERTIGKIFARSQDRKRWLKSNKPQRRNASIGASRDFLAQ